MSAAFETIGEATARAPVVLCCEHATNRLPEWTPTAADAPFLEDHWGYDIGAADVTRALAHEMSAAAVLSGYSRLVCDPNRAPQEASFVVEQVDGHRLSFNLGMDEKERARRAERYYAPYHAELDRVLGRRLSADPKTRLCSIHSFTPDYPGEAREMEVGVLFDAYEGLAERVAARIAEGGLRTVTNEPYSGYDGLIHAARRHGIAHHIPYLEIEVRQDLIESPETAERVAAQIAPALVAYGDDPNPER